MSSIAVDVDGRAYISGWTRGEFPGFTNLGGNDGSSSDIFVLKFDDQGNILWTSQFGTTGDDYTSDNGKKTIAVHSPSEIYVSGFTDGSFAGQANVGESDAFVVQLDIAGGVALMARLRSLLTQILMVPCI